MSNTAQIVDVYQNVRAMLEYRKVDVISSKLDQTKLISQIEGTDYVVIYGKRNADDIRGGAMVAAIIILPNSKYSTKTQDFAKLILSIQNSKEMSDPNIKFHNVVVVINNTSRVKAAKATEDSNRSGLSSLIQKKINSVINVDPSLLLVEVYNYRLFLIELPKHAVSQVHTIVDAEELKLVVDTLRKPINEFPRIMVGDPQIVWLGARPGQVIKIMRMSDSAGVFPTYRLVVAGELQEAE